jgi:uroporphyrinogen decarboxylase
MNSREIIANLLSRSPPKQVGLHESFWEDTLRKWTGQGYPVDEEGKPVDAVLHFGLDLCGASGKFDIMPLRDVDEVVDESAEWVLKRNGAGAVLRWWKEKSGTPEHVDFTMTDRKVWEREYRPHLLEVDRGRIDLDQGREFLKLRRDQGLWTYNGYMFLWELMRASMGDVTMFESLLTDPDWIHDFNRVYTDFYKAHLAIVLEEVGLPDGFWIFEDLGYRNGLYCSPKVLDELILPYYKELVDFLHGYGLPVLLHSCGGVSDAVSRIAQVGFDGLHPMEVKAGCDVVRFAEQYGDKLIFVGGLDVRILESGDRSLIRTSIVDLLSRMKDVGARYVFGSDHSISTNVDYADYQYAVEVYHENKMY